MSQFPSTFLLRSDLAFHMNTAEDDFLESVDHQIFFPIAVMGQWMEEAIAKEVMARELFVRGSFNPFNPTSMHFCGAKLDDVKIVDMEEEKGEETSSGAVARTDSGIAEVGGAVTMAAILTKVEEGEGHGEMFEKKLAPWRQSYLAEMSSLYGQKRIQPRHMLSRKKYEALVQRLKWIECKCAEGEANLPAEYSKVDQKYRLVRIEGKDGQNKLEMLAERKGAGRLFLCVDQLFDVLYQLHMNGRHGRSISMYSAARKKFANVTVECILKFLQGCEDCKKWNKNEKKLNTLLAHNPDKGKKIKYKLFFNFIGQLISCRNCPYKRQASQKQRSTDALRSHLKKYHPKMLRDSRNEKARTAEGNGAENLTEIG